jgi:Xaa-Pro aminopeptidase
LAERKREQRFKGESFPAISGAGEHGAIIHYRVTPESNQAIKPNEVYLIDSGAQYLDGTTDITRTIWTGPDAAPEAVRDHVTRVLAGHIGLARAVFPEGVAGAHLDAFGRQALWRAGLDYDHGTGHGVGSYLAVHEGPQNISKRPVSQALLPGMICSNEPGYYKTGEYGIRIENLVLVKPADIPNAERKMLEFETLTLAPIDRNLIDVAMLTQPERDWINGYHARVYATLADRLSETECDWLAKAAAPL